MHREQMRQGQLLGRDRETADVLRELNELRRSLHSLGTEYTADSTRAARMSARSANAPSNHSRRRPPALNAHTAAGAKARISGRMNSVSIASASCQAPGDLLGISQNRVTRRTHSSLLVVRPIGAANLIPHSGADAPTWASRAAPIPVINRHIVTVRSNASGTFHVPVTSRRTPKRKGPPAASR